MRILGVGLSGLIGRELGQRLARDGHVIIATSRIPERAREAAPFPALWIPWSGDQPLAHPELERIDVVINLAGEGIADERWSEARKKRLRDSRIHTTRHLVESLCRNPQILSGLKSFIQGSAIGIYGDCGDREIDEGQPARDGAFLSELVADWEQPLDALLSAKQCRVVKFRTGIVLASGGGALQRMIPVFREGVGGRLGSGEQWMSWIHIEDAVSAIATAVQDQNWSGVFNLVAPEPVTNRVFSQTLASALGTSLGPRVPRAALQLLYGEMSSIFFESQKVSPRALSEKHFAFRFPTLDGALEHLCAPLRSGKMELFCEQWVPQSPSVVFPFFSDERNLERLTPGFLKFKVLGKSTSELQVGTLIDYSLRLYGFPLRWQSRIGSWNPPRHFSDEQVNGPYQLWHHTHDFEPLGGGTLLRDRVQYHIPGGRLARWVVGGQVSKDVEQIFNYRRKMIREIFG